MVAKKGSLLENNIKLILELSGFKPILNKIYQGYEIDVFLQYGIKKIAFECKQYENSSLMLRNLIHQWDSKNKELNFDKIVLVLFGCNISREDYNLAKKYNILIWDEDKVSILLNKAIEKKNNNEEKILKKIGIKKNLKIKYSPQMDFIKEKIIELEKLGVRKGESKNKDFSSCIVLSLDEKFIIKREKEISGFLYKKIEKIKEEHIFQVYINLLKNGFLINGVIDNGKDSNFKDINLERITSIKNYLNKNGFREVNPNKKLRCYEYYLKKRSNSYQGQVSTYINFEIETGEDLDFIVELIDFLFKLKSSKCDNYKVIESTNNFDFIPS